MFDELESFIRSLFSKKSDQVVSLHEPTFSGNEKKYLLECLDSTFVSSVGPFVDQFERSIENYTGAKHAIACVNGTSALHISLKVAGVMPEDLVLTQSFTFVATCNAISYLGAQPYFLDVSNSCLSISPECMEDFLIKQTKKSNSGLIHKSTGKRIGACLVMHSFGHPAQLNELEDLCKTYEIPLVEDAAESLGSLYQGQHTGTLGDLGIFSFNGNKISTTGGGGVVITNSEKKAKKAKHLTTTAKIQGSYEFIHDEIGYNYRMPNINAALGCAQMEQIDVFKTKKRDLADNYKEFFNSYPEVDFFVEPQGTESNYWLNTIRLKDQEEKTRLLNFLNSKKIMARPAWKPMHELNMYSKCGRTSLVNTNRAYEQIVCLPSSVITSINI